MRNAIFLIGLVTNLALGQVPTITSMTSTSGAVGTSVTFTGTNFSATASNNIIHFGAAKALPISASATQLIVKVPYGATYAAPTITVSGLVAYAPQPFSVSFNNTGSISSTTVYPAVSKAVGTAPITGTVVADFDGDGKSDVAAVTSSGTVVLMLNTTSTFASPTFTTMTPLSLSSAANYVGLEAADFDGDGKLDLVQSNYVTAGGNIDVFLNTSTIGTISFSKQASITAIEAYYLASGDIDGDGRVDLVAGEAQIGNNSVYVFHNISTGTGAIAFNPTPVPLTVPGANGYDPESVAVADMDGDGRPEVLAVAGAGSIGNFASSGLLNVFYNTSAVGTISFLGAAQIGTSKAPQFVATGDLDGDGKLEMVVAHYNSGGPSSIEIFHNNNPAGSFSAGLVTLVNTLTVTGGPEALSVGDINGDGAPDIVATESAASAVSLFQNTGSLTFGSEVIIGTTASGPILCPLGDLDSDGKLDIVVSQNAANIAIIMNKQPAPTPPAQPTALSLSTSTATSITGSFAAASGSPSGYIVLRKSGSTPTDVPVNNNYSIGGSAGASTVAYIGAGTTFVDGGLTTGSNYYYAVFAYNGSGTTINYLTASPLTGNLIAGVTINSIAPASGGIGTTVTLVGNNFSSNPSNNVVKFNGTAANIISSTGTTITTFVPPGATTGTITVTTSGQTATSATNFTVSTATLNTPTITNFFPLSGPIGTSVTIYGAFNATASNNIVFFGATQATVTAATATQLTVTVPTGATYQPITVTTNGLTAFSRLAFDVTFNGGGGGVSASSFSSNVDFSVGTNAQSVALKDLDGDGRPDIISGNPTTTSSATISILQNLGLPGTTTSNSLSPQVTVSSGAQAAALQSVDLNGDGKPDIIAPGEFFGNVATTGSLTSSSISTMFTYGGNADKRGVAICDFDNDGLPDVANALNSLSSIGVCRNSGGNSVSSATFATQITFGADTSPTGLDVGDFDGDGKWDVAVANGGGNDLKILANTTTSAGNITFATGGSAITLTTGAVPTSVVVADLDLDGKPDISVTNIGESSVSVFFNTSTIGAISFNNQVKFSVNSGPSGLSVGDLDGDGKPDIVVTNGSANKLSILRNTSSPGSITSSSFATFSTLSTSALIPSGVLIGDVDGDGKPDLVVANQTSSSVSVFRNNIFSGSAPTISALSIGSGIVGTSINISGTNFDPNPLNNIIKVDGATAVISGTPTATSITAIVPPNASTGPVTITVNGQTASSSTSFFVVPSTPTATAATFVGSTSFTANWNASTSATYYSLDVSTDNTFSNSSAFVGSFNNFNVGNVTAYQVTGLQPGTTYYYQVSASDQTNTSNSSNAITTTTPTVPLISGFAPASGAIGSTVTINGSNFSSTPSNNVVYFGAAKATVGSSSTATQLSVTVPAGANFGAISVSVSGLTAYSQKFFDPIFQGGSLGANSFITPFVLNVGTGPNQVKLADLDNDGFTDVVCTNGTGNTISIYRNLGATSTLSTTSFGSNMSLATGNGPFALTIFDVDGDGLAEILTANSGGGSVSVLRNTSTSGVISFAPRYDISLAGPQPMGIANGDLNGDGKLDFAVSIYGSSTNNILVLQNTAKLGQVDANSFATPVSLTTQQDLEALAINDFDLDGKPDIAAVNAGPSSITIFRNVSSIAGLSASSFAAGINFNTDIAPNGFPVDLAVSDLNMDGLPDVAVSQNGNQKISIFQNTSTSSTPISFAPTVDLNIGNNPYGLVSTDFDGDGWPDLIANNQGDNNFSAIRNLAATGGITSGGFSAQQLFNAGNSPRGLAAGDLNHDGRPEIVTANNSDNSLSIFQNNFIVAAPIITNFTPNGGPVGTTVTITGTNFSTTAANNTVQFDGTSATITGTPTATSITTTVPTGANTGAITVTVGGQTATSPSNFTVTTTPAPTITSFTPTSGIVGATVTITGTNFSTTAANNTVQFHGTNAVIVGTPTATSIVTSVPSGATTGPITVTVGGIAFTSTSNFTVVSASATVQITGTSFPPSYNPGAAVMPSITVNDATQVSAVNFISWGISADSLTAVSIAVSGTANVFQASVSPTDPLGLQYYFQVLDNSQNEVFSRRGETVLVYPPSSTAQVLPALNYGDNISNYQIISIPLVLTKNDVASVFSALGAYDITKWRLYSYNGSANVEYPGFSSILPGEGYWLIVRNPTTINPGPGSAVTADANNPYLISLNAGWNLIGNPYNFNIVWSDVLAANGSPTTLKLETYQNSTLSLGSSTSIINKYSGAYVNTQSAMQLKIPAVKNANSGGRVGAITQETSSIDKAHWILPITVTNNLVTNKIGGVGMDPTAKLTGLDAFDELSAPVPDALGLPELDFPHPEMNSTFNRDVVPTEGNFTWNFSLKRRSPDPIIMQWDNISLTGNTKELYFYDKDSKSLVDMKQEGTYTFAQTSKSLQIVFGDMDYVHSILDGEMPVLQEPFPNPASADVTIPFFIPESMGQTRVAIKVYNSLGVDMGVVEDKVYSPGIYQVQWAPSLSGGLYVVNCKVGNVEGRFKMILK